MMQIQDVAPAKLKPWEDNPRLNDHAVTAVAESIRAFGFNVPILCDQSLTIIAGHTRWKAAGRLELPTVPVIILEMTDAQRRAFAVADNKVAEIADWDFPKLREVLEELRSEDVDLGSLGFSDEDLRRLLLDKGVDENEIPVVEGEPQTRPGDLITLGRHRLLCGDSRDPHALKTLCEEDRIDLVFGGPPCFNQKAFCYWPDFDSYFGDIRKIIGHCFALLKAGTVVVWHTGNDSGKDLTSRHSRTLEEAGLRYLDTIVWHKSNNPWTTQRSRHITSTGHYYPALVWESLLVYQKPGEMPHMAPEGSEYMYNFHTNVWSLPTVTSHQERGGHPAVCPVEIPYRCLQAYTGEKATVLDPFGGAGTTLVAAEKSGRKAYLMEQHPYYCDVIIARWQALTGARAERLSPPPSTTDIAGASGK